MRCGNRLLTTVLLVALLLVKSMASELLVFEDETQRQRYQNLTYQLRCPKCDNQNVADSNAPISADIRSKTYDMVIEGYSDQEIIDFMIARYTEFVTYKPQMSAVTIWLWLLPGFCLCAGLFFLWRLTRRSNTSIEPELTAQESARLKQLLEDEAP